MRLAIVIPTLNERASLTPTLVSARSALELGDVLVVTDGGSKDATTELAAGAGAEVVIGPAGRGVQLNRGATVALERGADALLFLHADSRLTHDARAEIASALDGGAVGGGFTVRFEPSTPLLRLGERVVNARTRAFRVPLGDQGQFVKASVFSAIGGFPAWPILEDLELLKRMRRRGRIAVVESPVTTSARRFHERGVLRTVTGNWLIWTLFFAGVAPSRLARLYRNVR